MTGSEKPVYCIGGLGVDAQVFDHYRFAGEKLVLPYLIPQPGESLRSFALRMAENITHQHFSLVGVSLGGILAQEIATHLPVDSLVLISSIQSGPHVPWLYRQALRVGGKTALKLAWKTDNPAIRNYIFTAKRAEHKRTLQDIYETTDYRLVEWAIPRIIRWPGVNLPPETDLLTIHGGSDRLFPAGKRKDINHLIAGAGHFMVITHLEQVNKAANRFLSSF